MSVEDKDETPSPTVRALRILRLSIFVAVLTGASFYGWGYYVRSLPFETTDDAFIEGDVIAVSPQVAGQVMNLLVETNQQVEAGDLLLEIDPEYYEERLAQQKAAIKLAEAGQRTAETNVELTRMTSEARLQQVEAEVQEARAVLDESRAQVEAAEAELKRADQEFERHQNEDKSIFSQRETDSAESLAQVAKAELIKARKQVTASEAAIAVVKGRLAEAQSGPQRVKVQQSEVDRYAAEIEAGHVALGQIKLDLEHTKIYAPVAGRVTRKNIDVGEQVKVGQMLMVIVPKEVWVEANFRETQLTDMRVGQEVEIRVDTYKKSHLFKGHVHSIQSGTGARFSLLPPQNATGNYVKVVQRIPVKIVFDTQLEEDLLLVPGMSVVPKVRVR
jgi:membrane fusion protein (multidrug efflux system)